MIQKYLYIYIKIKRSQPQQVMKEGTKSIENQNRCYYSVLERVGTMGCYQYTVFSILFLICLVSVSNFFISPYIFHQDPYTCPDFQEKECKQFVCSLPAEQRSSYTQKTMSTMGNQYGDMLCQRQSQITAMRQATLIGPIVGLLLGSLFSGIIGRRYTIIISLLASITGIIICLVMPTPNLVCIGLIVWGIGAEASYTLLINFITENTSQQYRIKCYVLLWTFFAFAAMTNTLLFYVFKNWKVILVFYYLTANVVGLILFTYFVQKTPIQLITRNSPEQAFSAFMRIADKNQVKDHNLTVDEIAQIKNMHKESIFTLVDIFGYESVRKDIIPMSLLSFLMIFEFYGPPLLLDKLNMDLFLNGILTGVSILAANSFINILPPFYRRKQFLIIFFICSAVFLFINYMQTRDNCKNCNGSIQILLIYAAFFLSRLFINLANGIFLISLNQMLPSQVRHIGYYWVVCFGRLSALIVPFLPKLSEKSIPLMLIFAIVGAICALMVLFIRQTTNILPPDVIQQLQIQNPDKEYSKIPHQLVN